MGNILYIVFALLSGLIKCCELSTLLTEIGGVAPDVFTSSVFSKAFVSDFNVTSSLTIKSSSISFVFNLFILLLTSTIFLPTNLFSLLLSNFSKSIGDTNYAGGI